MAFIRHEECPGGKSSDGLSVYDDGSYCEVCQKQFKGDTITKAVEEDDDEKQWTPIKGYYGDLTARGITEATCRKCDYQQGEDQYGKKIHIQLVKDDNGRLIDQKTRDRKKNFRWLGGSKYQGIFGSWSWPAGGKSVVLTEGELDWMSVSQAFDNKYATGSLSNGSGSVKKAMLTDWDKLMRFDHIILCFDNDEPGQKAVKEACELLPVGKVKIMTVPHKDANETLMKEGPGPIIRAYWDAKPFRPDGIREGREFTKDRLKKKRRKGYELPYPALNAMLMGLRDGEVTTFTAGSGIGKSTLARAIAYHLRTEHDLQIGNIYLEEDNDTTVDAYVALHAGVPLKRILNDPECISDEQWDAALAAVVWDKMMFYDHFGSLQSDRLLTMMRYMAASGCRFIVLDHISIVHSGNETNDERRDIDMLMSKLAAFVQETGVGVIAVVHLKRSQGKNFNEGGQVSLNDLRGSASIEQLSFNVIALERNQQDEKTKHLQTMRVLKCRITGDTGPADTLEWDAERGAYKLACPFSAAGGNLDPNTDGDIPF